MNVVLSPESVAEVTKLANYRAANRSAGGEVGSHPGSPNMGYVTRANSSVLTLRLVWQSSPMNSAMFRALGRGWAPA